jgi:hypothetical protein
MTRLIIFIVSGMLLLPVGANAAETVFMCKNVNNSFEREFTLKIDIDKKTIIWELVAKREPQITWNYTKNNTLKKENFDSSDAYTAGLGYMRMKQIW